MKKYIPRVGFRWLWVDKSGIPVPGKLDWYPWQASFFCIEWNDNLWILFSTNVRECN